jgi:hypothetical protein
VFEQVRKLVDDGGLRGVDPAEKIWFTQSFEQLRNAMSVIDHEIINAGEADGLPAALGQASMRQLLVQVLRLSPAEASRRVLAAEACGQRRSMLGEVLAPTRPVLAAAQRDGTVSAEQVSIIASGLAKVDRAGFDPADIDAGERLLTDFASTFGCKDLKHLTDRTVDAINPDGTLPNDRLCADRRDFVLRRCRDGMYAGEFRLTPTAGAKLSALLTPLARPRIDLLAGGSPDR